MTELGNPVAMYRVGRYYLEQDYDPDEALHWFKLAADHGNELAMYQIYKGYRDGKFTENNSDKIRYLRMAVDAKFGFAEYEYAKIQDKMHADIKLEYLKRAVEHGCTQAIYALGRLCYDEGRIDDAVEYFEKAARRDPAARTYLALLYCYSLDDWDRGMMLLHSASEQGYEPATEASAPSKETWTPALSSAYATCSTTPPIFLTREAMITIPTTTRMAWISVSRKKTKPSAWASPCRGSN